MPKNDKGATAAETISSDKWVSVDSKTIVFPQPDRYPTGDSSNSYQGSGDLDRPMQSMGKHRKLLEDPRFRIRPLQQVLSACAGAMITACFMTPLDVIKTRMQLQHSSPNKCFFYSNGLMDHLFSSGSDGLPNILNRRPKPQFTSTWDALIKISRHEGVWTLWSGLGPTLVSALPSTIIYFVAYEQFKAKYVKMYQNHLQKKSESGSSTRVKDEALPAVVPMMSGVSARVSAVTVVSPIELVRTKMQAQRQTYAQMLQFVRNVIALQGIWGLWRGLRPTILRDVPFSGIYWPIYEYLKRSLGSGSSQPSFGLSFFAGVLAGSVAAIVTTPFDVVKTLEQIEFGERVIFTDSPTKDVGQRSTYSRLAAVYKMHGVRGLFAGVGPRLLKVAPACAIMISTFEYSKSFFFYYNVKQHNEALLLSNPNATLVKEEDLE
ncbi:solute carrier family 25 protein Shawn [Drosophila bipectinata]|uniref:solute carrier family 25 protein Shawn n=1 Tax=Drosophila bipectinata TaxID=42026 RepID=UPI0038B29ED5